MNHLEKNWWHYNEISRVAGKKKSYHCAILPRDLCQVIDLRLKRNVYVEKRKMKVPRVSFHFMAVDIQIITKKSPLSEPCEALKGSNYQSEGKQLDNLIVY